jgi:lysozyme family protein
MAIFQNGYLRTNKNEGGDYAWSNNPADPGGETFMGITRRSHPNWEGWDLIDHAAGRIDNHITDPDFPRNLRNFPQLIGLVQGLYKKTYWDPMMLDSVGNQAVAEKLYDIGVNAGSGVAVKLLQRALNAANKKGTLWPDMLIDGVMGSQTINAITACEGAGRIKGLLAGMKCLIGAYYFTLMEKNEKLEEFYMGWLTRAME